MIKVNNTEIKVGHFPDGTQSIEFSDTQPYDNINKVEWFYDSDEEVFTLMCVVDMIRRNSKNSIINLRVPYLPNARMDRIKEKKQNFSLKVFANLINSLDFGCVMTYNVHSSVSEALINNIFNMSPNSDVGAVISKYKPDVIYFPDEGACKRYADLACIKNYGLPVIFGIKKRDFATGKILGLDVVSDIDLKGKKVLIVDDIISKGFTFFYSGNKLKELGAVSIGLYASHCEDTILDGELLKDKSPIDIIYTTDSILHIEHNKIKIIRKFRN